MVVKIKWSDTYCVRLPEIDEQQKQIVERINRVVDAINASNDQKDIYEMISDLTDFVRHRFSIEEKGMIDCHYPDLLLHRKDHREFIRKIIAFRKMFADETQNIKDDFIRNMEEWISSHSENWDGKYAPFSRLSRYIFECNAAKKKDRACK
jgi:hemerythrin